VAPSSYDSVIVGLSPPDFTYDSLNTAFRILKGEHYTPPSSDPPPSKLPPLIATHRARYIGAPDGRLSLGPGPFVSALEVAAGAQALVVGKPTRTFFELVIGSFDPAEISDVDHNDRGKIAVIGDDVEADLAGGALELGLWRILG
jgi:ribonucleotide monophosphatase NagD (HAD superfamily)